MVPILDVHILCLVHISMTFEPTGDTCTLLLVGVVCGFGTISHVQQGGKRIAKCTLKDFQEVSVVSNTSLNARIWSFSALSNLSILPWTSHCILDLCLCFRFFCQSPNSFSLLSSQLFFLFDIATLTTSATIIALGTINLCKCTQLGFSFTFLNGTGVCAQGTPLISFLSGTEVGGTSHQLRTHSARLLASH